MSSETRHTRMLRHTRHESALDLPYLTNPHAHPPPAGVGMLYANVPPTLQIAARKRLCTARGLARLRMRLKTVRPQKPRKPSKLALEDVVCAHAAEALVGVGAMLE